MNQTEQWIYWLTRGNQKQKKEATLALGGLNTDSEVDVVALTSALETENEKILFWVIGALGALCSRSNQATERIIELCNHPYLAVRQSAVMALSKISPSDPRINKILISKLEDENEFVRCNVLSSFIAMDFVGDEEIDAIKKMLTDKSKFVVEKAEVTLRNIKIRGKYV
ncbi:HEAT repeat domain-containing protein [Microbulbifer sp. MKSA007]|nr:HEAT repeat domain-containing protein [Microbulbifer sp. MKSA007]